ncbi:MAG: DUF4363 family protein [Clostridia bacterium]|nr:DUF4363 family protein [Clostridia bacterium]
MKKVLWAGILAVFSVISCIFLMFYIINISDKTVDSIKSIQQDFSTSNFKSAHKKAEKLNDYWEENQHILSIMVHHEMLEEIEQCIALIKTSIDISQEPKNDNFWIESNKATIYLENLREVEIPTLGNIL